MNFATVFKMQKIGSDIIITLSLLAINAIIFILMVTFGVSFFEPTTECILNWGGINSETLLSYNQWWRLFSSLFVHIGLLHLIMNLYILFDIGSHLEPIIGKLRFLLVYLVTGVLANLISQSFHLNSYVVEAGASGAIFGIIGTLFALLTTPLLSPEIKDALWKRVLTLIGVNIMYGLKSPNISMAAHMGGLVSGFILGYVLYPSLIFFQFERKLKFATLSVITVITAFIAFESLKNMKKSDSIRLDQMLSELTVLERNAIDMYRKAAPTTTAAMIVFFHNEFLPEWNKLKLIGDKLNQLNLSESKAKLRDHAVKWIHLHMEKYSLMFQGMKENTEDYMPKIKLIDEEISQVFVEKGES